MAVYDLENLTVSLLCSFEIDDLFYFFQHSVQPLPRLGGRGDDVPLPAFVCRGNIVDVLACLHARELVRLGRDDGKGNEVIVQIFHHGAVVGGGIVADIAQRKDVGDVLLRGEKFVQGPCPLRLFRLAHPCISVPRQVGKNERTEIEIVDEARSAGLLRDAGELLLVGKHVDERALADVGFSADGDDGFIGLEKLFPACRARDEFCICYLYHNYRLTIAVLKTASTSDTGIKRTACLIF